MRTRKPPAPNARKQTPVEQATDDLLEAPRAVIDRLRAFMAEPQGSDDFLEIPPPVGEGTRASALEAPAPVIGGGEPLAVERSFAFVDICGFTAYCDRHGERAAIEVLTRFRNATREVAARRGIRVAKWLGDGVMLVSTDPAPLVAAVVELVSRFQVTGLDTHAGLAAGPVLLFEGDDYIGRAVNLAARLADAAEPAEILAAGPLPELPEWVHHLGQVSVQVTGMGTVGGVCRLGPDPVVADALHRASTAA